MSKKPDAYLKLRGKKRYYSVVVNIPEELRHFYPLKTTSGFRDKQVQALGTTDKIKARMLRDKIVAEIFLEFDELRNLKPPQKPSLTETYEIQLAAIQEAKERGESPASVSGLKAGLDMLEDHRRDYPELYTTDEDPIKLAEARYKAWGTASVHIMTEAYIKHHHEFSESMKQKMRRYAKELIHFIGVDIDPERLTTSQAREFIRDLNQQSNRGHKVKKDTAGGLSKLWAWAKRHELVSNNIFEGARDDIHVGKRGTAKKRYPFSNKDVIDTLDGLHTITKHQKMLPVLTLLGLFTGVREAELTGLRVEHILEGHIFNIVAGKNNEAVRTIPTHQVLHPLIDHLTKTSKDGWLIPDIPNRKTARSAYASSAFSEFKQDLWGKGLRPEITFHSFRHRMEDLFRDAEIPVEIRHRLTGRKDQGSEGEYGMGVTIARTEKALGTIQQGVQVDEAVRRLLKKVLQEKN